MNANQCLIIREALPEEKEVIGSLLVEAFVKTYAQKMPSVAVSDERKRELRNVPVTSNFAVVLVAELECRIVGTVSVFKPGTPESGAWIANAATVKYLAIHPELQCRGLSKPLLDRAESIAKSWKIDAICLHSRRGISGVARLYINRGYVRDESGDLNYLSVYLEGYVLQCNPHKP